MLQLQMVLQIWRPVFEAWWYFVASTECTTNLIILIQNNDYFQLEMWRYVWVVLMLKTWLVTYMMSLAEMQEESKNIYFYKGKWQK